MASQQKDKTKKPRNERRGEILAASKKLFTEQGYEKTTMQQVVKEAGTSIGNCYFYFPNKEALLEALIEELMTGIRSEIDDIYKTVTSNYGKLACATYILIHRLTQSPLYVNLFQGSPKTRLYVTSYYRAGLKRLFANTPQLVGKMDPGYSSLAWEGTCMVLLDYYKSGEFYDKIDELIPFLIRWNLQAIRAPAEETEAAIEAVIQRYYGRANHPAKIEA